MNKRHSLTRCIYRLCFHQALLNSNLLSLPMLRWTQLYQLPPLSHLSTSPLFFKYFIFSTMKSGLYSSKTLRLPYYKSLPVPLANHTLLHQLALLHGQKVRTLTQKSSTFHKPSLAMRYLQRAPDRCSPAIHICLQQFLRYNSHPKEWTTGELMHKTSKKHQRQAKFRKSTF